ncbi:hypothetical protein SRB521_00377 [Intestinimonas butyriciproducens]|nr:hypothetical protein SRB521_00377 [Intestinimonas butyriciproducens]
MIIFGTLQLIFFMISITWNLKFVEREFLMSTFLDSILECGF